MAAQVVDLLGCERQSALRAGEDSGANAVADAARVQLVSAGECVTRTGRRLEAFETDAAEAVIGEGGRGETGEAAAGVDRCVSGHSEEPLGRGAPSAGGGRTDQHRPFEYTFGRRHLEVRGPVAVASISSSRRGAFNITDGGRTTETDLRQQNDDDYTTTTHLKSSSPWKGCTLCEYFLPCVQ